MNSPIFDKFLSDADSYHNFSSKDSSLRVADNLLNPQENYSATDTSSIKVTYKKLDPFVTKLPRAFFESEEDLDEKQISDAVAYFTKK